MKNERGFEALDFTDDYGLAYSLQESSVGCHVWLGVPNPKVMVLRDAGLKEFVMPEDSYVDARMHLNRAQAKELAEKLNYFAEHGCLPE